MLLYQIYIQNWILNVDVEILAVSHPHLAFCKWFPPTLRLYCESGTVGEFVLYLSAVRVLGFPLFFLPGRSIGQENAGAFHDCVFGTFYCMTGTRSLCFHYLANFINSSIDVQQVVYVEWYISTPNHCAYLLTYCLLRMENFIVVASLSVHTFCIVRND